MSAVFVLLPLALLIAGGMLALFIWAVRSGQYDDLDTPAMRVLFDEDALDRERRAGPADPAGPPPPGEERDAAVRERS